MVQWPQCSFSNFSNWQPHPCWFLVVFQKLPLPELANRIQLECDFGQLLVTGDFSPGLGGKNAVIMSEWARHMSHTAHPLLKSHQIDYCLLSLSPNHVLGLVLPTLTNTQTICLMICFICMAKTLMMLPWWVWAVRMQELYPQAL